MTTSSRWAMKLSVMALALSVMAIFWVWAVKTTPCAGAQATCPIALTRVISQGLTINDDAADSDSRLEGDTNANLQYWDAGADSIGLGAVVTAGAFNTLTGFTTNRAGVTSVGRELHAPAGTFTDTNAASTTLAVGARGFIGAPTFAGANASQVITDAFNYVFAAPAAGTNMTLTRAYTVGMNAGTTGTLWLSRDTDSTTAAGGLLFGLSRDVNLYRSAANVLRTDDDFTAANLTITSFAANWTNAGRTVADLGIVTTADINGGTADNVTVGAATAAAGTFTGVTVNNTGNALVTYSSSTTAGNAYPRMGVMNTNVTQEDFNISEFHVNAGNGTVSGGLIATYSSLAAWAPGLILRTATNHSLRFWTNGTERVVIAAGGDVSSSGNVVASAGVRIGADSGNNEIDDASQGAANTTLYIGNASINVTVSDARLKDVMGPSTVNALSEINRLPLVDYTWNANAENLAARSAQPWVGMVAQDLYAMPDFAKYVVRPIGTDNRASLATDAAILRAAVAPLIADAEAAETVAKAAESESAATERSAEELGKAADAAEKMASALDPKDTSVPATTKHNDATSKRSAALTARFTADQKKAAAVTARAQAETKRAAADDARRKAHAAQEAVATADSYWSIDYQYMVPLAFKGIQELYAEVNTLKARLVALEAKVP